MKIHTKHYLVREGEEVDLEKRPTTVDPVYGSKSRYEEILAKHVDKLSALQQLHYASSRCAVLLIFQAMDAAGKDGAIRHVMSGVSPQGVDVYPFKQPSAEELAHDYLWRCAKVLPERGRIAIFNRSYYEELTVVRVHRSLLEREDLPPEPSGAKLWNERYQDIASFERHLVRNGTLVVKFFLHLSKDEQRKRLLERIDMPNKNWKISAADIHERAYWSSYQNAYELLLTHTSIEEAPWYIIPSDHKWFARAAIADVLVARIKELGLTYPAVTEEQRSQLTIERKALANGSTPKPTHQVDGVPS